jgi:hypothetical protein
MNVAEQIRKVIEKVPQNKPFGYADLEIKPSDFLAAAKALERLQKKGTIKKVSKGIFYKPQLTILGPLGPDYNAMLNDFLFENGKRVAYITGGELYNQLNLTTQNYFRTKIATNKSRKKIEIGWIKATTVKAYVDVTDENFELLGILDAIKDIKNIADTPTATVFKILAGIIVKLNKDKIENLIALCMNYPPRVRALVGFIIENKFGAEFNLNDLKKSLNPATIYKLNIKENEFANINNWNIK